MSKYFFDPFRYEGGAAGGGAGAAGAAAGAATTGEAAAPSAGDKTVKVLYGKQPDAVTAGQVNGGTNDLDAEGQPSTHTTSNTLEDKRKAFDQMVNGEYKDQFTERMQQIINRRFKESKQMSAQLQSQGKIMQLLSSKYGVDAGDVDALYSAINQDDAFFEDEASKAGMTVKQFKEMRQLQAERDQLQAMVRNADQQRQAQETYSRWMQQAEQVKQMYPQFDLRQELTNESFGRLLKAGIDVRTAYQVVHQDELMQKGMMAAANNAAAATAKSIQAQKNRPAENGAGSSPGVIVKSDVSKFTKADRQDIIRRVMRGEKISL